MRGEVEERRRGMPLCLRRGRVLAELRHWGLAKHGRSLLEAWERGGLLVPVVVPGAVRKLYARDTLLRLIEEAVTARAGGAGGEGKGD